MKQSKKGRGIVAWARKIQEIHAGVRTASTKKRKKIRKKNDRIMKKIIKELLAFEQEQKDSHRKFEGAQQRHHWSDVFARRNSIYRLLKCISQKSNIKSLRPKTHNIVESLTKISTPLQLHFYVLNTPGEDRLEVCMCTTCAALDSLFVSKTLH